MTDVPQRRKSDLETRMGDATRAALIALLVAGAFLAGVLTANQQTRDIVNQVNAKVESQGQTIAKLVGDFEGELQAHRERDRQHICFAALDHLDSNLALRNLAEQAGLRVESIGTRLRPEVIEVCAEIGVNGRH